MTFTRFILAAVAVASISFTTACSVDPPETKTETEKPAVTPAPTATPTPQSTNPQVLIKTSMGDMTVELWPEKAPLTVANFLEYTDNKHYDGTVFHRVISTFMVQGGGFTPEMRQKPCLAPIKNEASSDVPNKRGTLAMARTGVVDSATAQFFINVVDNASLNHRDETQRGFGYCVFGEVIEGMDVADKIKGVPTTTIRTPAGQPMKNVPITPVVINSVTQIGAE